ncbi:MAG: 8-amino-7-oxononanoate synthase [Saprospiraceae bacterium]
MHGLEEFLQARLADRKAQNSFRYLQYTEGLIDFCSNDYLGLARMNLGDEAFKPQRHPWGATGSRLISGHSLLAERLETYLATFHKAEAALLFNSGYQANLGLIASVTTRHDTLLYDQLVHASLRDGIQLAAGAAINFRHNDIQHLEEKLQRAKGRKIVLIESIYSMDGDEAPLEQIVSLCEQYGAALIVDEAHATGVFGERGEGLVVARGLEQRVWARVHTFGKAIGAHGAAVVGSTLLKEYLINFCRPFIYTTALPDHLLERIRLAYLEMEKGEQINVLRERISLFLQQLNLEAKNAFLPSNSPIQCLVIPGNQAVKVVAQALQSSGFDLRPILSPTVPKGQERIRICIHAFNTEEQIIQLTRLIHQNLSIHAARNFY